MKQIKPFDSFMINESLSGDLFYLKSLFTPSDDLYDDLSHDYYDAYKDYFYDVTDAEVVPDESYDNDPFTFVQYDLNRKQRLKFGKWLYDQWKSNSYDMRDMYGEEIPLFSTASFTKIHRNEWLVHFTDYADYIIKDGFTGGIMDPKHLAYTFTAHSTDRDDDGGWFFAYHNNDAVQFGVTSYNHTKYGSEAVMFMASGVEIFHYGDNEPQVIFNGEHTKHLIPIKKNDDDMWYIENKRNMDTVYEDEDLGGMIQWIKDHFQQYRKVIAY
jgi:hypothetical protein